MEKKFFIFSGECRNFNIFVYRGSGLLYVNKWVRVVLLSVKVMWGWCGYGLYFWCVLWYCE